jgi:hypothetical protein
MIGLIPNKKTSIRNDTQLFAVVFQLVIVGK